MAVSKIIRAQDILKEKGYTAPKFDTMGFQSAAADFFRKSDVSARLTVFSVRFLDYEGAPLSGFHACTEYTSREYDDILASVHAGRDGDGYTYDYPLPPFLGSRFGTLGYTDEIGIPYIIVDEPYITNAVGLLKLCGFIVSRKHKTFGIPSYTVTLT